MGLRIPGYEVAARCLPARDVSGDFYDWYEGSDGGLTLKVGDVIGKGMPAALLMATVKAALRAGEAQHEPAATLDRVRLALGGDLERMDSYVTLFRARIDLATHRLS